MSARFQHGLTCLGIIAIATSIGCQPSKETLCKWYNKGQEGKIIAFVEESFKQTDKEDQAKAIDAITAFLIETKAQNVQIQVEKSILSNNITLDVKKQLFGKLSESSIVPKDVDGFFFYYLNLPEAEQSINPMFEKYLSKISEPTLYNLFSPLCASYLKDMTFKECLSKLEKYKQIGKQEHDHINDLFESVKKCIKIQDVRSYLKVQFDDINKTIEKKRTDLKENESNYAELKISQSKTFHLHGFMVSKTGDFQYEVDVDGQRVLLWAFKTQFQTKGYFSLPVRKMMDLPVTLKEQYGGFTQNWPVLVEVDQEKDQDSLNESVGKITTSKKELSEAQNELTKCNSEIKKVENDFKIAYEACKL